MPKQIGKSFGDELAAASMTDAQIEAYCRANDKVYKLAEAEDAIKLLRVQV